MFTTNNWNHCQYINQDHRAVISIGANDNLDNFQLLYFVTVLDSENNEMFQQELHDLDAACNLINNKYSEFWEFKNLSVAEETSGCSTCVAH
ncbi:MAG: hypothetical protein HON90_07015 [Halobacteriovoraceae bacterium]|jgi:hypothetical protein|nr:hypothetical protein [Halobacteriovoraceae bacterium]